MNPSTIATVVDLQGARRQRRLEMYRARVNERLSAHRAAIDALYQSGNLFTPQGSQTGRASLRAVGLLQRALSRLEYLEGGGVIPAPRLPEGIDAVYREVDTLLSRADTLSGRYSREASVAHLPGR